MVNGAVLKFRYGTGQALILAAKTNWHLFDGWCAIRALDPLELPSRRFFNVVLAFLKEGLIEEGLQLLEKDLDRTAQLEHPYVSLGTSRKRKRHLAVVPEGAKAIEVPKERWRAPEGWTPAGWDEDRSYQNAKGFMGFQANPGGKK